ncbi:MAG: SDR family oxidoreductase [Verrucomicrobia bacterium]|nr:SDR family oxidoreductase [Verrucomicrobiota bacterium]
MPKVAIVTGAGSGIGQTVSHRLASEGWSVAAADLNAEAAALTAKQISNAGGSVHAVAVDIASAESCATMVSASVARFGRVDALVNCAGISKPGDSLTYSKADWEQMIAVQLNGTFFTAQAVGRQLVQQGGGGALVFISSTNAEAAFPRRAAYCAAKAGVAMLTKVLAVEWAAHGIRVNAVGPAYVETEMTLRNIAAGNVSREAIERRIPLGRLARPGDVADAISFLLSDRASFITGHSLYVDGGWLAYGYL